MEAFIVSHEATPSHTSTRCIDPLDGTVNFAHKIPGFNVSVGVLRHAIPVAGCVIEFVGGPGGWKQVWDC